MGSSDGNDIGSVRDFFFRLLNKEFLIFLFFLLLSGTFWFIIATNETYEKEFLVPVALTNVPQKVVVTSETEDTLRLTVRDKGYMLLAYQYGGQMGSMPLNFKNFDKGSGKISVAQTEMQKLLYRRLYKSSKIISIKPDKLSFSYNNGESKKVHIRLRGIVRPGSNYYIARTKFQPDEVKVYAEQQKLDSIQYVYTEALNMTNLTDTVVTTVRLQKKKGVKCDPEEVSVTVFPDILTEESVEVPITALNMPEGKVLRTFPSRLKVIFVTGASLYRNIHAEQFKLVVDYNTLTENGADKCAVRLTAVPHGVRNARPEVPEVDYLIENR